MALIKKLKLAGLATLTAVGLLTLAACSPGLKQAQKDLNETMEDKINSSEAMKDIGVSKIDKYIFLGADIEKEQDKYIVELNGIAKYDNGKQGYVNAGLKIEESKFENISNKTEKKEVLSLLTQSLKEYDFEYLEVLDVENIKDLSKAVTISVDSPVEGYRYSSGMLYGLSNPIIDYEEGYAVFQAKSYVKFSKTETTVTYGLQGVDSKGSPKFGPVIVTKTYYDQYMHKNNFYIRATQEQLKEMEQNPQLVYKKFAEMYKAKDKENYIVQSLEVEKSNEIDTNMFQNASLDLGK